MRKNEKGFGAISILAGIIIVSVIAAVGWLVYDNQKTETQTNTEQQEQTKVVTKSEYTYELPDNWSEIACGQENSETNPAFALAFPANDKAKDCEDRRNTVIIGMLPYEIDNSTKCETLEEVNSQAEKGGKLPYLSYKCEEIYVSNVRVLTYSHTQDEVYTEEKGDILGLKSYDFTGKKPLNISYYSSDTKGALVYLSEVDNLVKSVKLN